MASPHQETNENIPAVTGLNPWLPWPLSGWAWWTEPVRAERLAALRIGVGLVLLLDVLAFYLPRATDFFGRGSLGAPGVFTGPVRLLDGHRTLLSGIEAPAAWVLLLLLWAGAAVCLTLGVRPRLSAAVAWLLSLCVLATNDYLHNGGDRVRSILLFYLMLCPSGAVWSVDSWRRQRHGPVFVAPWALRLLFVQLVLIYLFNGVYKLLGDGWRSGDVLHYVMGDLSWSRFPSSYLPLPAPLMRAMTWLVMFWEVGFPLLVLMPATRTATLLLGVAFHLGTGLTLQLGPFPLYMLCLYLPLLPWERLPAAGKPERLRALFRAGRLFPARASHGPCLRDTEPSPSINESSSN